MGEFHHADLIYGRVCPHGSNGLTVEHGETFWFTMSFRCRFDKTSHRRETSAARGKVVGPVGGKGVC